MNRKLVIYISSSLLILLVFIFSFCTYKIFFKKNVQIASKKRYLFISSNSSYSDILDSISPVLVSRNTFNLASWIFRYNKYFKPGKYLLYDGLNNYKLIRDILRQGRQEDVKFVFNYIEDIYQFASVAGKQIELDSAQIVSFFLTKAEDEQIDALSILIPNTYFLFWNISAEELWNRMKIENDKFWNHKRLTKAKKIKLSKYEIYTLASIVENETIHKDEMRRIAGLYLNRLRKGMKLQSDPTVIYALKKVRKKKNIRRVLYRDLLVDSKYNTYLYKNLPPGPISVASSNAIDAVLNAEEHEFIFMCASVEKSGYHEFAKNQNKHKKNRQKYINWLNKQGIKR